MSSTLVPDPIPFVDRRDYSGPGNVPGTERRQFTNSYSDLSAEARALGMAVDQYKLHHRRRFVNFEEMLAIIKGLGYTKDVRYDA
jgi:hypothetical protein